MSAGRRNACRPRKREKPTEEARGLLIRSQYVPTPALLDTVIYRHAACSSRATCFGLYWPSSGRYSTDNLIASYAIDMQ